MKNPSLLTLVLIVVVLLLLAASPLAAATSTWPHVSCGSDGSSYAANSTYEANLHRLAAVLPAETASASHRRNTYRAIGYWPNRLQASSSCRGGGDCAACIAEAFKEVERECPFRREAFYFGDDCNLRLSEYSIFSDDTLRTNTMKQNFAMVMIFQAFGLACIFFLFLQAWRHDIKKGPTTRQSPLLSGNQ